MNKKFILVSFFLFLLMLFPAIASAQTTTGTDSASKANRLKDQIKIINDQRQEALRTKKETRVELRQKIKDRIQTKREEVKEIIAAKREEFKAKLQTIRNQKKKVLVERIDTKLTNINTKHTDRFAETLVKLQTLLDKISSSATEEKVLADIKAVQGAIDAATAAIEAQAAKTYAITISTENALRSDVGRVTSQLRLDLVAVHKMVVDAKQAVQSLRPNSVIIEKKATGSANL